MPSTDVTAIDANTQPWQERFNEQAGKNLYRKDLFADPDTGMEVRMVRYPAGFTNPLHIHHCAHGMYVLEGALKTREREFGVGSFVWFPEGNVMEHGATADEDVTVLLSPTSPSTSTTSPGPRTAPTKGCSRFTRKGEGKTEGPDLVGRGVFGGTLQTRVGAGRSAVAPPETRRDDNRTHVGPKPRIGDCGPTSSIARGIDGVSSPDKTEGS